MPETDTPTLQRYLAAWLMLGTSTLVVSGWLAVGLVEDGEGLGQVVAPLFAVTAMTVVADRLQIVLPVGRSAFAVHLLEVAVVLGMVLLPAPLVAPAVVLGQALGQVSRRVARKKAVFNLAVTAVAAALAGLATLPIADPADLTVAADAGAGVVALIAAGVVFGLVNGAAIGALMRILTVGTSGCEQPSWPALATEGAALLAVSVPLAVLAAVLLETVPTALPLLVLLIWLVHRTLDQGLGRTARQEAEHQRLERSVAGAADGILLLDPEGRIELANPAAVDLLGRTSEDLLGRALDEVLETCTSDADATVHQLLQPNEAATDRDSDGGGIRFACGRRMLRAESSLVFDHRAAVSGWVVMLSDITEAHEIDALRREFVARVSHELRTPLTAILGITQTLRCHSDRLEAAQREQFVAMAERQTRRLRRLVDDLLWSARIDANPPAATPEAVGLRTCVDNVAATLTDLLPEGFEVDVDGIVVRADPDHLEQILMNLLVNAVRYGDPPVAVRAVACRGTVSIVVSDHGAGVPEDFEPELFTSFSQASTGDRREAQGLGLGLSIVASLTAANAGAVRYRRREELTCFEVTLPAAEDAEMVLAP